jgi:hypothetical protein
LKKEGLLSGGLNMNFDWFITCIRQHAEVLNDFLPEAALELLNKSLQ